MVALMYIGQPSYSSRKSIAFNQSPLPPSLLLLYVLLSLFLSLGDHLVELLSASSRVLTYFPVFFTLLSLSPPFRFPDLYSQIYLKDIFVWY